MEGQPLLVEKTIGNYQLLWVLGQGGMGVVYEAKHRLIGKRVAIKVLHQNYAENPEIAQRFFNEARSVNQIGHENIIDIHDYGFEEDGSPYFVMELLQGRSLLSDLSQQKPLPYPRTLHIAHQILNALSATHQANIIHRDLKPENIFLIKRGEDPDFVKLLDFGIAKIFHHKETTKAGILLGTPAYMSPEQILGENVDHRADIYSVGVLLYELFTGKPPYNATSAPMLLAKRITEPPPSPREINNKLPLSIENLILHALEKEPDKRYQSITELRQELEHASQDLRETAAFAVQYPEPTRNRTTLSEAAGEGIPKPTSSSRGKWAIGSAAALLAGGALFFILSGGSPPQVQMPASLPTPRQNETQPTSAPSIIEPASTTLEASPLPNPKKTKTKKKPLFPTR